jgi:tRNA1(Val) A37 N6-methylase TrmN6
VDLTDGTLLGGKLRYQQPRDGYRTGLEPVLLAASVPAQPGDTVVEAGCGAGAGLLCLAARVPGVTGTGIERDMAMASLAQANFAANGFAGIEVQPVAIEEWQADGVFDHALANPPWHDAAGTPSPVAGRAAAKRAAPGLLAAWAGCLARVLRPRGTLSLLVPAAALPEAVGALLSAKCPEMTLLPLWPKAGSPAKLILLRGVRLGRGASTVLPGLVLHEPDGAFTPAADAILRRGLALPPASGG